VAALPLPQNHRLSDLTLILIKILVLQPSTFSSSSLMGFSFANLILINSLRAAPVDRRN